MLALFKAVMAPRTPNTKPKTINLGAASCVFKKPIPPFARYEVSSRVLCWDQKWVYVVSHFTKPGTSRPTGFLLGAQAASSKMGRVVEKKEERDEGVYASAIAKYVFKAGRVTCKPEEVLVECGLMPWSSGEHGGLKNGNAVEGRWSWEEVQDECRKQLPLAQNLASLDQLHQTRVGGSGPALYAY
jgi:hypothetical protein